MITSTQPPVFAKALGVHAPDRATSGPFAYRKGGLRAWLALLGRRDGGGALCHWKVRDEAWDWIEARVPAPDAVHLLLLEDCAALNFKPLVAYCPFTLGRPGSDLDLQGKRSALSMAMRKFLGSLPRGCAVIFGNEHERAWKGDPQTWFDLEAEFGFLARQYGHSWFVGGDLVELNTLETFAQRQAAWRRYGVEPDGIALHSYGQDGFLARHVADVWEALKRVTGRAWRLIWTEWGWGFPGAGKTRADRRDLDRADTGAYCGEIALAFDAAGVEACAFTLDQHFGEDGLPTLAAEEFASTVKSREVFTPRQPPVEAAKRKTLRYLSLGRSALGVALAKARTLIS